MSNLSRLIEKRRATLPPIDKTFFGMHVRYGSSYSAPQTPFHDLGYGTIRTQDCQLFWRDLEKNAKGVFNFARLDEYLNAAQANDFRVILVLGQAPDWATGGTSSSLYGTGYNALPPNPNDFTDYINAVVAHIRVGWPDLVVDFELWNEVNMAGFWGGTDQQLIDICEAAYAAIKSVWPGAIVVSPNVTAIGGVGVMERLAVAGLYEFCDKVGVHLYNMPAYPERAAVLADGYKKVLSKYGITKGIWNTEQTYDTNYEDGVKNAANVFGSHSATLDDVAISYVVRMAITAYLAGCERHVFYGMDYYASKIRLVDLANPTVQTLVSSAFGTMTEALVGCALVEKKAAWPLYRIAFQSESRTGEVIYCFDDRSVQVDLSEFSRGVDAVGSPIALSASYTVTHQPIYVFR